MCVQKTPLSELIYIADNLAYFPYQQQDEPLFIMHQLDIIVSVSGSNLLQSFKEVCLFMQLSGGSHAHGPCSPSIGECSYPLADPGGVPIRPCPLFQ